MDDCIDSLGAARVFSTLDANWGYWQLPIWPQDRDKTALVCHSGTYRYKRMPFGLVNAPASFQRALDVILAGYKWQTCLVYLDDVVIFSKTVADHIGHVDTILSALSAAGVSLRLEKCEFFTSEITYLGHIIRPGRLSVDAAHTKCLRDASHPRTQTELRSFLGFVNVYRRFIKDFAHIAAPLNALLRKGMPAKLEEFGEPEMAAFHRLTDAVLRPPVLELPKSGLRYSVDTDSSGSQIGCTLFQAADSGQREPLQYWSRSLNTHERNYSTPEKECLAVVWALLTFRPYLQYEKFTVFSHQSSLRWVRSVGDTSGRLMQ